jgi:hypothetical protein
LDSCHDEETPQIHFPQNARKISRCDRCAICESQNVVISISAVFYRISSGQWPDFMQLLSSVDAAAALGISVATLYDWLSQSNLGTFEIRGQSVTVDYFQGGRRGQGRIQIDRQEIERLLGLMRVSPKAVPVRKLPSKQPTFQHLSAKLGRPED